VALPPRFSLQLVRRGQASLPHLRFLRSFLSCAMVLHTSGLFLREEAEEPHDCAQPILIHYPFFQLLTCVREFSFVRCLPAFPGGSRNPIRTEQWLLL